MLEDYFFTKNTKWILWGGAGAIAVLLVFHAGVVVGSHQGRNMMYVRGTHAPGGMIDGIMPGNAYLENGHGAVGKVEDLSLPHFTILTRDGMTQKIFAGSSTIVTGMSPNDLTAIQNGQVVIVVGDPDDADEGAYLDARIVHILPPPPGASSSMQIIEVAR
jgi:hypothetical protein